MTSSYIDKVIMMFKTFNSDMNSFIPLFEELSSDKSKGIIYEYYHNHTSFLDMHVGGVGLLRLHFDMGFRSCDFTFKIDNNNLLPEFKKIIHTKADMDLICERVLPFIVSKGSEKRQIPLLLKDFPSFATFALEFTYDPYY